MSEPTITLPLAVVEEALFALKQSYAAVLVVRKGELDAPYPDEPAFTPYTRWYRPAGRRAHDAAGALVRSLKEAGHTPPIGSRGQIVALSRDIKAEKTCDLCSADATTHPGGSDA